MAHEHEHEFLVLLVGVIIWIFIQSAKGKLKDLPDWALFTAAFNVFLASMVLTILEDYFWEHVFNLIEHVGYAVSTILLALWSWRVFMLEKRELMRGDS